MSHQMNVPNCEYFFKYSPDAKCLRRSIRGFVCSICWAMIHLCQLCQFRYFFLFSLSLYLFRSPVFANLLKNFFTLQTPNSNGKHFKRLRHAIKTNINLFSHSFSCAVCCECFDKRECRI